MAKTRLELTYNAFRRSRWVSSQSHLKNLTTASYYAAIGCLLEALKYPLGDPVGDVFENQAVEYFTIAAISARPLLEQLYGDAYKSGV